MQHLYDEILVCGEIYTMIYIIQIEHDGVLIRLVIWCGVMALMVVLMVSKYVVSIF